MKLRQRIIRPQSRNKGVQLKMENKIIPLNIVFTYPVHWKTFQIFRDYIQNFYDSVPCDQWYERFHYDFHDNTLSMRIEGQTFNYEWLLHIGASTKTNSDQKHAGYFGEGFKIASLCALRDKQWEIRMSSGNWSLKVIHTDHIIDGKKVQMLAYDLAESEINIPQSELILQGISNEDFNIFKIALKSFYYPENELLGKKIWEDCDGAVYTRSKVQYDYELPYNYNFGRKGIVFCGYQIRGSNPFDLVVCLHDFEQNDRERDSLLEMEVVTVFKRMSAILPAEASFKIVEKMRRVWISNSTDRFDFESWTPVLRRLLSNILYSSEYCKKFKDKYPNLLYLYPNLSKVQMNWRQEARSWYKNVRDKYVLVGEPFSLLGYSSLEDECRRNGGLVKDDNLHSELEKNCFLILKDVCRNLFSDFFIADPWPSHKIITNPKAAYHGMATLYKNKRKQSNKMHLCIRNKIDCVYLKRSIIEADKFYDGLSTYVHEMCHMFGGDSSENFSIGLTHAMEILLENTAIVESAHQKWRQQFCDKA